MNVAKFILDNYVSIPLKSGHGVKLSRENPTEQEVGFWSNVSIPLKSGHGVKLRDS